MRLNVSSHTVHTSKIMSYFKPYNTTVQNEESMSLKGRTGTRRVFLLMDSSVRSTDWSIIGADRRDKALFFLFLVTGYAQLDVR